MSSTVWFACCCSTQMGALPIDVLVAIISNINFYAGRELGIAGHEFQRSAKQGVNGPQRPFPTGHRAPLLVNTLLGGRWRYTCVFCKWHLQHSLPVCLGLRWRLHSRFEQTRSG